MKARTLRSCYLNVWALVTDFPGCTPPRVKPTVFDMCGQDYVAHCELVKDMKLVFSSHVDPKVYICQNLLIGYLLSNLFTYLTKVLLKFLA